ncbi:GMC oxidoreductase [Seiridium cupressi]
MAESFEFTVVGSGPAGGAVAAGLATSGKKPSVLLLKAGGSNDDHSLRVDGQRWQTLLRQGLNWGYKTVPQEHCANREIDYSRGKGLGGSSAINFGVYTVGARNDYERNGLGSQAMKLSDGTRPKRVSRHWKPLMAVSLLASMPRYAAEWEHDLPPLLDTFESVGFAINPDHNSGNPLGMSVLINTASKGVRSTSKDLLLPYPENLTVVTESPVQRLVLEGSKAVGVESNGNKYYAPNEVVLSAGALDSPKIMMHSGLGAANQLERFNIPVLDAVTSSKEFQDLPKEEQAYLQSETVPHMEVFTHFPMHWFIPNFPKESLDYNCFLAFLYNSQGRGEVTLQSSDPNVSLLFDPEFLAHAFDRRAAIESLRTVLKVVRSEEDLLKYWEQTISSSWHMTGTLKMGEKGDADAVMDPDFRVLGVQNLRVADMSAVPVLASARTQAVAYVTGIICAEKLIAEYGLA